MRALPRTVMSLSLVFVASTLAIVSAQAPPRTDVPTIPFDASTDFLKITPDMNFGEVLGVAVNSKGLVIVSDELRHDLKTFDHKGNVVQLFGGQGTELGALSFPTAIAVGADDRLFVAERGNRRVQIYDLIEAPAPRQR